MEDKSGPGPAVGTGRAAEDAWLRYYRDESWRRQLMLKDVALMVNQRRLVRELSDEISALLLKRKSAALWSAGSGVDRISLALKERFGDSLELTIEDISPECIGMNRELFARRGLSAEFVTGDLFRSSHEERFDIVSNSGLLEHFGLEEQRRLMSVFRKSLRPGGSYLTVTPSGRGRAYVFLRRKAVELGRWPYGPEEPVKSLRFLSSDGLELVGESQAGALDQLLFVEVPYPKLGKALRPAVAVARRTPLAVDPFLCSMMGGYCVLSKFRRTG